LPASTESAWAPVIRSAKLRIMFSRGARCAWSRCAAVQPDRLLLRDPAGGFADISIYDVIGANDVIHVIDKVLPPAQNP
jgi:hypothetical protein